MTYDQIAKDVSKKKKDDLVYVASAIIDMVQSEYSAEERMDMVEDFLETMGFDPHKEIEYVVRIKGTFREEPDTGVATGWLDTALRRHWQEERCVFPQGKEFDECLSFTVEKVSE